MAWLPVKNGMIYCFNGKDLSETVSLAFEVAECYSDTRRIPWFAKWDVLVRHEYDWNNNNCTQAFERVQQLLAKRYGPRDQPSTAPPGYDSFNQLERVIRKAGETTYTFRLVPGGTRREFDQNQLAHAQRVHCRVKSYFKSRFDKEYWSTEKLTDRVWAP